MAKLCSRNELLNIHPGGKPLPGPRVLGQVERAHLAADAQGLPGVTQRGPT